MRLVWREVREGSKKMPPERDTPAGAFRLSIRKIGCSMNKSGTGTLWGLPAGNAAFVLFLIKADEA
jgi:hypothetical protein